MKQNINDIDIIERALMNSLNSEENKLFEKRWSSQEFRALYEQEKLLFDHIQMEGKSQLKAQMKKLEADSVKRLKLNKIILWILACILGLLLILMLSRIIWPSEESKLFAQYYQPLANLVDPISKGQVGELSAFQLYEKALYQEALDLLNTSTDKSENALYKGLCHIELGQFPEAITNLEPIASDSDHSYQQEAQWYLSLAYLKNDNKIKLNQLLEEISRQPNHFYSAKALQLIQSLQ